jgi:threonine dehydratase
MVSLSDVEAARDRIAPYVHRTPVLTSGLLDERAGRAVYFKCENFQRVGAFKFRGAMNALLQISGSAGVITHSSGNHAQALALAA